MEEGAIINMTNNFITKTSTPCFISKKWAKKLKKINKRGKRKKR